MRKVVLNYARSLGTHPHITCDRTVLQNVVEQSVANRICKPWCVILCIRDYTRFFLAATQAFGNFHNNSCNDIRNQYSGLQITIEM
jgi:hypothetical protein